VFYVIKISDQSLHQCICSISFRPFSINVLLSVCELLPFFSPFGKQYLLPKCVLLCSVVTKMNDEQQSSEHTCDSGADHVNGELKDLAIPLASSKEAMRGWGPL